MPKIPQIADNSADTQQLDRAVYQPLLVDGPEVYMRRHKKTGDTALDAQHAALVKTMADLTLVMLHGNSDKIHVAWMAFKDVVEQHFTYENTYLHLLPKDEANQHHREHIQTLQAVRDYNFHDDAQHQLLKTIFNQIGVHLCSDSEANLAALIRQAQGPART